MLRESDRSIERIFGVTCRYCITHLFSLVQDFPFRVRMKLETSVGAAVTDSLTEGLVCEAWLPSEDEATELSCRLFASLLVSSHRKDHGRALVSCMHFC